MCRCTRGIIIMSTASASIEGLKGLIFELPEARDSQLNLLKLIPGLSAEERYFLMTLISLCQDSPHRLTDQEAISNSLEIAGRKKSPSVIKKRASKLFELGLFSKTMVSRPRKKAAAVYSLNDLAELHDSEKLAQREHELNPEKSPIQWRPELNIEDPNALIEGQASYQHSYTRKLNHTILRRCSSNPDLLGKKIPIPLIGYDETVGVTQRTLTGIPPMNGEEDQLQQALMTMFKEHLASMKKKLPDTDISTVENSWIIDMRQVCRAMKLAVSSGNIETQAKRLFVIRYNNFEIYFDPEGEAAQQLGLNEPADDRIHYLDEENQAIHKLSKDRIEHSFLTELEPAIDEVIWHASSSQLDLLNENDNSQTQRNSKFSNSSFDEDTSLNDLVRDSDGRLYRFYRISFQSRIFKECIGEILGQIHKNPPSLLTESRRFARLLTNVSQRVLGKKRFTPFVQTWYEVAQETSPCEEKIANTFASMKSLFVKEFNSEETKTFYKKYLKREKPTKWSPHDDCFVCLHGYVYKTQVPDGMKAKRKGWKLIHMINPIHEYTGPKGPAAVARMLNDPVFKGLEHIEALPLEGS